MISNPDIEETRHRLQAIQLQTLDLASNIAGESFKSHNSGMEHVPRPELDAKLATIEAKMEGRLARIDDGLAGIQSRMNEQRSLTLNVTGAIIATVIATAVAVAALGFSAFDSGRETEKLLSETRRTIEASLRDTQQKQASFELSLQQASQQQREARQTTEDLLRAIQAFEKTQPPARLDKFIVPPAQPDPYPPRQK